MPTTDEWQAIARNATDSLPPLSDEQNRALTLIARRAAHERLRQAHERLMRPDAAV